MPQRIRCSLNAFLALTLPPDILPSEARGEWNGFTIAMLFRKRGAYSGFIESGGTDLSNGMQRSDGTGVQSTFHKTNREVIAAGIDRREIKYLTNEHHEMRLRSSYVDLNMIPNWYISGPKGQYGSAESMASVTFLLYSLVT